MTMDQATSIPKDGFQGAGDDFYQLLMTAHEGLDQQASAALNARLVLIMANEVGDMDRLRAIVEVASRRD